MKFLSHSQSSRFVAIWIPAIGKWCEIIVLIYGWKALF